MLVLHATPGYLNPWVTATAFGQLSPDQEDNLSPDTGTGQCADMLSQLFICACLVAVCLQRCASRSACRCWFCSRSSRWRWPKGLACSARRVRISAICANSVVRSAPVRRGSYVVVVVVVARWSLVSIVQHLLCDQWKTPFSSNGAVNCLRADTNITEPLSLLYMHMRRDRQHKIWCPGDFLSV